MSVWHRYLAISAVASAAAAVAVVINLVLTP